MSRIEQLTEMLLNNANDCFLQHALALENIKIGNDNTAQNLFESILQTDPNYVGSYYHLGKLHERNGAVNDAIVIYKKGMEVAKSLKDNHSYNELQTALEDIEE